MQLHGVGHTTTATTATLAAAPGAGKKIVVTDLHISAAGPSTVTAGFSGTNQRVYDLAANQTVDDVGMKWEGDENAAFTVQSGGAVTVDSSIDYHVENYA